MSTPRIFIPRHSYPRVLALPQSIVRPVPIVQATLPLNEWLGPISFTDWHCAMLGLQIASFLIPSTTAPELDIRSQMNPSRSDDNTFVVKIQLPLRGTDTTMMVYNRDKSFSGLIPGNTADGEELAKIIREKGVMKAKGYFEAHVDQQTKELVVLKGRMLQPQPW
ncbi:unnamed protein product [Ostreobium quekettii]|uniref:Uncharacterized protein n=1 Tax=Ostreobium quekettii TaxID=121088 RepID=A0A8S1IL46_9CHLO|nr:unnamed protein product [Ostreobium quekettii]